MAETHSKPQLTCMGCGAPIPQGFFCKACEAGVTPDNKRTNTTESKFLGKAGAARKKELFVEDMTRTVKRIVILAVLAGVGFIVWANFGDQITAYAKRMMKVTEKKERYDPTRDAQVVDSEDEVPGTQKRPLSESPLGRTDPQ